MLQMLFRLYPIICLARNSGGADCPCPVLLCFFINHEHSRPDCRCRHKVNHAPDTKPGSKCYNKGLQNVYCAIEKCHKYILSAASAAVRQADKRRSAYAAAQKNRPLVKAAVPALRKFCGAAVFSCRGCGSCRCVLRRGSGGAYHVACVSVLDVRSAP